MRHRNSGRKLNRTSSHRRALFANMSQALLEHEQIKTTLAKAKSLRPVVEKLITQAKRGQLAQRRRVAAFLYNPLIVQKLFSTIAERYRERPGGYTRIIHAGTRYGDAAPMAFIELVERQQSSKEE